MKVSLLKLVAISAGVVLGLALAGLALYSIAHRHQKSWDSRAVTARLAKYAIYENHDKPDEPHYYTNIFYDVTNNTSEDYILPVEARTNLMQQESGTLLGSSGWDVSLAQGILPYSVPSGFFDPKPIRIPSHTTVQILFVNDAAYTNDHVEGKTKEQIVAGQFRHVDRLVILDDVARYRIDFPLGEFWKTAPERE